MMSSLDEEAAVVVSKDRLLCVSDGFTIYCLDLDRECRDCFDVPKPLPLVSTINLLEEGYPISASLFQFNALGLMVGGKEIPDFKEQPTDDLEQQQLQLPQGIFDKYGYNGSSKETYQLFLVDGILRVSIYFDIPQLSKPKSYPKVEKIDNHLHVIESSPHCSRFTSHDWIPSHEVLDLHHPDLGWMEVLPPMGQGIVPDIAKWSMFMSDELVLGDKMFAIPCLGPVFEFYALDCKTEDSKWEFHGNSLDTPDTPRLHVGHLLGHESLICVGRIHKPVPCYAVIGFGNSWNSCGQEEDDVFDSTVLAKAFLMSPTGEVICYQSLPQFFDELRPITMNRATLFRVADTDSDTSSCLVLHGDYYEECPPSVVRVVYISTFCVDMEEANLDFLVQQQGEQGEIEERKFVEIVIKKKQVHLLGENLSAGDVGGGSDFPPLPPPCLTACFI